MKMKLLLATLALAASPTLALAACFDGHAKAEDTVMSCAAGSTYDTETQRCVPTTG